MNNTEPRYWEEKSLDELSDTEWESLCDGCGKCCLHKFEDEDTEEIHYTNIACRFLGNHCQCTEYRRRREFVAGCICLVPGETRHFHWLPSTCAYRLIAEGKPLATWHPLNSGNPETIHLAGISVRGRVLSDAFVHEDGMEEHIITWVQ